MCDLIYVEVYGEWYCPIKRKAVWGCKGCNKKGVDKRKKV